VPRGTGKWEGSGEGFPGKNGENTIKHLGIPGKKYGKIVFLIG
jgi:hypothetical protein